MIAVYILAGLYGLCVGSFLNVVIYRLPRDMNLAKPGSHCTTCGYALKWYDNIPVLSYIMLGGKCRKCHEHISFRYTAVEIMNTLLWLLCVRMFWAQSPLYAIAMMLALSIFVCIAFIDLETMFINDILIYLLAVPVIMAAISGAGATIAERAIGLAAGGGLFLLIYLGARLVLKREGMGTGDILLMAAVGALLGWKATIFAILVASVTGTVVLIPIKLCRKGNKEKAAAEAAAEISTETAEEATAIEENAESDETEEESDENGDYEFPFGPFIILGAVAAIFLADKAIGWYLGLFA